MKRTLKSKTARRQQRPRAMPSSSKRRVVIAVVIAVTLLLSLLAASALLAQRGSLWPAAARRNVAVQNEPTSLTSPSKEYVYAGSRLVATEEPCAVTLLPMSAFFLAVGTETSFNVTAQASCNWSATTSDSWLTVETPSGSGNDQVAYIVRDNPSANSRTGAIVVNGQTFTVVQAGLNCEYAITPTLVSFNASGSGGSDASISVTAGSTCQWLVSSNSSWITITSGSLGNGNGTVSYSVASNNTGAARQGSITIANQTCTVKQKK